MKQTIRKLFERLRAEDQRHTPSFEALLSKPTRRVAFTARHQASMFSQLSVALLTVTVIVAVALFLFFKFVSSNRPPRMAANSLPNQSAAEDTSAATINFADIRNSMNRFLESSRVPDWKTPSDSLLAIDLELVSAKD